MALRDWHAGVVNLRIEYFLVEQLAKDIVEGARLFARFVKFTLVGPDPGVDRDLGSDRLLYQF